MNGDSIKQIMKYNIPDGVIVRVEFCNHQGEMFDIDAFWASSKLVKIGDEVTLLIYSDITRGIYNGVVKDIFYEEGVDNNHNQIVIPRK